MTRETDIRILGGLPVTIEYTVQGAEPDVGIMSGYVDDWYIVAINGRAVKKCDWLERRIDATKGERERIVEELNELANEPDDYYDY